MGPIDKKTPPSPIVAHQTEHRATASVDMLTSAPSLQRRDTVGRNGLGERLAANAPTQGLHDASATFDLHETYMDMHSAWEETPEGRGVLGDLAIDVLSQAFSFLSLDDILTLSLINREFSKSARDNSVWREQCEQQGWAVPGERAHENLSYKTLFQMHIDVARALQRFRPPSGDIDDATPKMLHELREIVAAAPAEANYLRELDLSHYALDAASTSAIAEMFPRLQRLNLDHCSLRPEDSEALTRLGELRVLSMQHVDGAARTVMGLPGGLLKIKLSHVVLSAAEMQVIVHKNPAIAYFDARHCGLDEAAVQALCSLQSLACLDIGNNLIGHNAFTQETTNAAQAVKSTLAKLPRGLRMLGITNTPLGGDEIAQITTSSPRLAWVDVSGCSLGSSDAEHLYKLTELRFVNISRNRLERISPSIGNLKSLVEWIDFNNPGSPLPFPEDIPLPARLQRRPMSPGSTLRIRSAPGTSGGNSPMDRSMPIEAFSNSPRAASPPSSPRATPRNTTPRLLRPSSRSRESLLRDLRPATDEEILHDTSEPANSDGNGRGDGHGGNNSNNT